MNNITQTNHSVSRTNKTKIEYIKKDWLTVLDKENWLPFETCLASIASMTLKNNDKCMRIILIGQSGSGKTEILNMFKDLPNDMTYYTDSFTPASFLTQAMNVARNEIENVDLIRRLPDKVMVVPDLAPLIGMNNETLQQNMSRLVRIMDGEGYANDGGVHGHREFREECIFTLIGGIVNIPNNTWNIVSQIGTRLLFFKMKEMTEFDSMKRALIRQLRTETSFRPTVRRIKTETEDLIRDLITRNGIRGKKWNTAIGHNEKQLLKIAMLVSILRASNGNMEAPFRVHNQLKNLARGRALIYERDYLTKGDLSLSLKVALSSVRGLRGKLVAHIIKSSPVPCVLEELIPATDNQDTKVREELNALVTLGIIKKDRPGRADCWFLENNWTMLKDIVH